MQPAPTAPDVSAPREGDQPIPGFVLVRPRGRGGFGEVWEAEASGGFRVALKFVRLSPRARVAELRALEFVRDIRHPNLLASFGSWTVGDFLIVGMELADRSLWDRYVEAGDEGLLGIPRSELLGYMGDSAAGIDHLNDYCHTLDGRGGVGVQHRDLKPPNILLFGGGAKVADLGMARTMEGSVAGHTGIWTFPYAAPEFFRGQTHRRSDQYCLAVTYCQLRSGRLPFEGNAAMVSAGHLFGRPDLDDLPEAERPILERALAKEPDDRWPDCRALVEALRSLAPEVAPEQLTGEGAGRRGDIPRELRSSTGSIAAFATGPDPIDEAGSAPVWREFESTDSGVFPLDTPGEPEKSGGPPASMTTAILPDPPREPDPVTVPPVPTRRSTRPKRAAVAAMAAAVALATAGVHAPGDREHGSRPAFRAGTPTGPDAPAPAGPTAPAPAEPTTTAPARVSAPSPAEAPTPTPEVASVVAIPPRHRPEPEPAPAAAAEELRLVSTLPAEDNLPPVAVASRSDLAPGPRARRGVGPEGRAPFPSIPAAGLVDEAGPFLPPGEGDGEGAEGLRPIEDVRPATRHRKAAPEGQSTHQTLALASPTRSPTALARPTRPSPAELAAARGRDFSAREAFDRAIAEFDEAIRLDPGRAASYLARADARHRTGRFREALADYTEALQRRPGDASAYTARGQAHHDLGAYDRAIADYAEAIRLNPGVAAAHYRRGLARYRSGNYAGSVPDFTEAIRLDPKNARAYQYRADAFARLGAGARARADHDRAAALEGSSSRPTPPTAPTAPKPARVDPSPRPTRRGTSAGIAG